MREKPEKAPPGEDRGAAGAALEIVAAPQIAPPRDTHTLLVSR